MVVTALISGAGLVPPHSLMGWCLISVLRLSASNISLCLFRYRYFSRALDVEWGRQKNLPENGEKGVRADRIYVIRTFQSGKWPFKSSKNEIELITVLKYSKRVLWNEPSRFFKNWIEENYNKIEYRKRVNLSWKRYPPVFMGENWHLCQARKTEVGIRYPKISSAHQQTFILSASTAGFVQKTCYKHQKKAWFGWLFILGIGSIHRGKGYYY